MNILKNKIVMAQAQTAVDEVERKKFIREARKAAKRAQDIMNILARRPEPSDTPMEYKNLDEVEKEILGLGSEDELDDVDRALLNLQLKGGDETEDELSEPNVFIREAKGSNSEQNNRVGTSLSKSTAPEKTDDSFSEQSETSGPFDDRDDVPSGRNLLVLVDSNRAAGIFGPVSRKLWKTSEQFSSINSTISKDNTGGECARQAKLFAHFGRKMKMKQCGFGSAHREKDMLHEVFNPYLEAPIIFEEGLHSQRRKGTPNYNSSSKFGSWDTSPSRLVPPFQRQQLSFPPGSNGPPPGFTFEPRHMKDIFPDQSTTKFPPLPPLDPPLDYQQAKAVHLGRSQSRLGVDGIDAYGKYKEKEKVAQRQREQSNGNKSYPSQQMATQQPSQQQLPPQHNSALPNQHPLHQHSSSIGQPRSYTPNGFENRAYAPPPLQQQ
jgi:hypothetical protein